MPNGGSTGTALRSTPQSNLALRRMSIAICAFAIGNPDIFSKERLRKEGGQSVTNCHRLKLPAADGKSYLADWIKRRKGFVGQMMTNKPVTPLSYPIEFPFELSFVPLNHPIVFYSQPTTLPNCALDICHALGGPEGLQMQSAGRPGRQAQGDPAPRRVAEPAGRPTRARARETPRFFFYKKDCSGLKVLCCMPVTNMLYSERGMENRIL